jgi:hypothetical protein
LFESTPEPRKRCVQQNRSFLTSKVRGKKHLITKNEKEGRCSSDGNGASPSVEMIVHHSGNPERSIPAERRAHQVPLDDTLMVTADNFLLLVLVLAAELELGGELDAEGLPETVSSPKISEKKGI